MVKGEMKQVKILKRPTPTALPTTNPADKVAAELTALMEACLSRERARLESAYRARHEALLRVVSDVLNQSLERLVASAAKRETDNLMGAYIKLSTSNPEAPVLPPIDTDRVKATREAFAAAFEKVALPRFEERIGDLLKDVGAVIDKQVEEKLIEPSSGVLHVLEGAADSLRSVKSDVAEMMVDSDASDMALVQSALDSGDVAAAFRLSIGKSVAVQAKAVSGVLDSNVGPEDAFRDWAPPTRSLIKITALLTMDLSDRTEARLGWLYEVVTMMDDDETADFDEEETTKLHMLINGSIDRLTDFQKNGSPSPTEAKHAKLLIRVLKAHLTPRVH